MSTRVVLARLAALASLVASVLVFTLVTERECAASPKDECIEAHSRGQDLREKGQLSRARQVFMTCAQSQCPGLIQGDCARFGEELGRLLPSVSFGARDAAAGDLPVTSVYVDDVLVTTRLDDGKSYEFDPGKHNVRFVHDGKDTTLKAILNQGEKGRLLVATFADENVPASAADARVASPSSSRSALPLVVAGLGAAAMATGGVLLAVGMKEVPSGCTISSRECAAPPGDPSLGQASRGVALANAGLGVGIGGAAVLVGGLVWYFVQPSTMTPTQTGRAQLVSPWIGRDSAGVGVVGSF